MNTEAGNYVPVVLGSIVPSATNPRKNFDEASMAELTASVREAGVQQPILLRKVGEKFEIVCGERRFRAATAAGLETIPAIVRELDDAAAYQAQIIENLQREGVHPAEEADSYAAMMGPDGLDMSVEDVAKKVGKTTGYVAQRLRLRMLEIDAKLLFIKGTITLGHALLLARLTPVDQERAIRFMLDCDPKYDKRSITELVRARLGLRADPVEGDDEEDDDEDEGISYNMPNPQVAKYMRHGRRIVDATEAQLKRWIESNVLLKLASVPWRLDDAELLPAAGACVTCPKRSGSNAALFGDLTAESDVCLDTVCFSAKQDATLKAHKAAAKDDGMQLLKVSSKASEAELEEIAVSNGSCVTRKTVKRGQWVPATENGKTSCGNTLQALMVDGPDKGKLIWCCADQKCKVHKHDIRKPGSYGYSSPPVDPVKAAAEKAKVEAFIAGESALRREAYDLIVMHVKEPEPKEDPDGAILRFFIFEKLDGMYGDQADSEKICVELGIPVPPKIEAAKTSAQYSEDRKRDQKIDDLLRKAIETATPEQLWLIAFHVISLDVLDVSEHHAKNVIGGRRELLAVASRHGLAKSVQAVFDRAVKKATAKPAAKKAAPAAKVVAKGKKAPKAKLSAESRKRIADAIKKRWSAAGKKAAKA
jgi:ParB family chromosome partitioning protein